MRRMLVSALLLPILAFSGCATNVLRIPASFKPSYNSKVATALKSAALNGVLFQVNDSVFRDVPSRQVESCCKAEAPTWSHVFISFLDLMDRNPDFYNRFYIVDFRRGDKSKVEINQDIDGLSSLTISYAKRENREKVTLLSSMPCAESTAQHLGKDLITTLIDWPTNEDIEAVLKATPNKIKIDRFHFNTDFLVYLAERQAILKINPEVAFERTFQGEYFLGRWLEKMSQNLKENPQLDFLNYWFKEISDRSNQAKPIQFFGLHAEGRVSYGIQVDSVGKFNRKINNFQEPTYLFMSYREKGGDYIYNSLKDLNTCLQGLLGSYRSINMAYDADRDSFLAPGYSCKLAGEE